MEIVVTGRHVDVSDRFRAHVEEKLTKVAQLEPRVRRIDVMVSHETNRRQAKACDRVEITCRVKGPVVRAEACQSDKYAALDVALDKLMERLRRRHDKRQIVQRGGKRPESLASVPSEPALQVAETGAEEHGHEATLDSFADSPVEVREKVHASTPMTIADALREMELVGHDFYLFHDSETGRDSVLYRRRGWSYGVLTLDLEAGAALAEESTA